MPLLAAAVLAAGLLADPGNAASLRRQPVASNAAQLPELESEPLVWPLPKRVDCTKGASGPLSAGVTLISASASDSEVVKEALARYQSLLHAAGAPGGKASHVEVSVHSKDEHLGSRTDYSYALSAGPGAAAVNVSAASPYGVAYALETLLQLQRKGCASFSVEDAPEYAHRGLMLDAGRRFWPVSLMRSTIDAMAMVKMNVLHWHLSEQCFRVESKAHPALHTRPCRVGAGRGRELENNEFYTQDEVRSLVQYAGLRGVRVVPEFDVPGHAGGLCKGLQHEGMTCCHGPLGFQIRNDPEGKNAGLVQSVLQEMAGLFPDELWHIGGDEAGLAAGQEGCRQDEVQSLLERVAGFVSTKLNKTAMGWQEAQPALERVRGAVFHKWRGGMFFQGFAGYEHRIVKSDMDNFYLDYPDKTPRLMWMDIKREEDDVFRQELLGGETSMWMDHYVPGERSPSAACLFQSPERDVDFANSTSSTVWPRAAIAAGSFWRHDPSKIGGHGFNSLLQGLSERLQARGVPACPCSTPDSNGCWQEEFCGQRWCTKEDDRLLDGNGWHA